METGASLPLGRKGVGVIESLSWELRRAEKWRGTRSEERKMFIRRTKHPARPVRAWHLGRRATTLVSGGMATKNRAIDNFTAKLRPMSAAKEKKKRMEAERRLQRALGEAQAKNY